MGKVDCGLKMLIEPIEYWQAASKNCKKLSSKACGYFPGYVFEFIEHSYAEASTYGRNNVIQRPRTYSL